MLLDEGRLAVLAQQAADHRHGARGVEHMDDRFAVMRRDFHRRVRLAGGRAADEQRQFQPLRSISRATCAISSSDGVISPLRPMMSAFCSWRVSRIFSHGTITPRSMTS